MKTYVAGIIAEYNPLHNGHVRLLAAARAAGATHLAVVMSGNFVQRGGPALFPKSVRARAAVAAGADLVLELPLPHAMSTAQRFARGSVFLLGALGCVDMLAFGSECGDLQHLRRAAKTLHSPECSALTKRRLETGIPYAAARQKALADLSGMETAALLETPNNTLAIEYLTALVHYGLSMTPYTIQRDGAPHDSETAGAHSASASLLRNLVLREGVQAIAPYVPGEAFRLYLGGEGSSLPCREAKLETAVLAALRCMERDAFAQLPDISEGLDGRLYNGARCAVSLADLLGRVKTKRYALSRIRRLVWNAFLGVPAGMAQDTPPYLRILAMSARGKELLAAAHPTLPLSASLRDLERLGGACARFARLEARAGDLYALALPEPQPCGGDYTHRIHKVKTPAFDITAD